MTARFTFAAGNARGVRRLPLYALGALATLIVPRSPSVWVFGSGVGPGEGALPLYLLARKRLPERIRLVWLCTTDAELVRAHALGLHAVRKLALRGLWLTLRAGVVVVTHGLGDVNRYAVRGSFIVQLWHGIPLKRLHLDAPIALTASSRLRRELVRRGYRAVGRQIGLFPVASEAAAGRIATAFGLPPAALVVTGDPRDDVLLLGDGAGRRTRAQTLLAEVFGSLGGGPLVAYAPTWRDGDPDPATPGEQEWAALVRWLDRVDGTLVVRSHPLGLGDYDRGPALSPRVRLLVSTDVTDLNTVLPAIDVLVTDYSSVAYDFALTGGATVFLAADLTTYLETRGFYEPYDRFTDGQHITTWTQVLEMLDVIVRDGPEAAAARDRSHALRDRSFAYLDGRSTERVLAHVLHRIGQGPAPASTNARVVTRIELFDDHLEVLVQGTGSSCLAPVLVGARERVEVAHELVEGGLVRLAVPLLIDRWGAKGLALPTGDYRLVIDGAEAARVAVEAGPLPVRLTPMFRATVLADSAGLLLRLGPPLRDDERGPRAQRRLRLLQVRPRRLEDAVYFESFYGRSASDNPAGIDRALSRLSPGTTRYWSVSDRSVALPEGAIPIVEYSAEWWRVRSTARVYVINDWLRWTYRKRAGQHVLQTWHGTMLKRLALDRPGHTPRMRFAVVRQSLRWSAMLAQNGYSTRIFRSAYAFRGPIWETGYPRNDVLVDPTRAAQVRALLAVDPATRLVLYAPTWRDDRTEMVDHLDLLGLAARLPADHVLLVRGHSRTLGHGRNLQGDRLLDVTSFPDVADLMLVADVLVTDYSSVMFDFAATGKPIVFHVPDRAHYGGMLRGFYFDLLADGPGPVVETGDELLQAVLHAEAAAAMFEPNYAAWRARFTPHEDGLAGERAVRRMLDEGWLS